MVTISELQNINFISKTNFNNLPPSITHSDQDQIWVNFLSGKEIRAEELSVWGGEGVEPGLGLTETKVLEVQIMSV